MPPRKDLEADLIRVRHMADAAKETASFIKGKKRASLNKDRMLTLALIKELEILGEAANRVSLGFQKSHPEIPWTAIVATRNRLIHGYFDMDLDIVWATVTQHLPPLRKVLLAALAKHKT